MKYLYNNWPTLRPIVKSGTFFRVVFMAVFVILASTLTYWYWGTLWFIVGLLDLIAIIAFIVIALQSLVFWIINCKEFRFAWLPALISGLMLLVPLFTPSYLYNKQHPVSSLNLAPVCKCNPQVYLESYRVYSQGAWGGDAEALYITDKKTFRVFLCKFDQDTDSIKWECNGDRISFIKHRTDGDRSESRTFSLQRLIAEKRFE